MADTSGHHLVYGELTDYLTGEKIPDTDDERLRQQLARFMVEQKGYQKKELQPRLFIETTFNNQYVKSIIELTILMDQKKLMIVRYGPGSLVTRERAAIAAARILERDYLVPLAVVTNSRDAELLDSRSGKVLALGLENIPARQQLKELLPSFSFEPLSCGSQYEKEARILNVFDVEVCCRGTKCLTP